MLDTAPDHVSFEKDLRQCIRLAEKNNNPSFNAEYLLANLCARGLLIKFYDENNHIMETIPLVSSTYKYMKRSFNFTGECSDLYYYTGAYNYYRVAYPEIYPVYKPLAMLLQQGNKERGLRELHLATTNAVVLKAESYSLLASIYLNFENKYELSCNYSKTLHEIYPDNMLYLSIYIKSLLLLKQYDEAEKLIRASLKRIENKFFQTQLIVFQGIIQEKKYKDFNLAMQLYKSGIAKIVPFREYGDEYTAYAYFGLSRISILKSDKNSGNMYRQKALKLGDFKKINFDK
jgi:tetratricopeptide (TPR) repeat protein